jgi:hypothetical protein
MQDLNEMKYLDRVVKEALRLYPSVPFIGRILKEDTKIGTACTDSARDSYGLRHWLRLQIYFRRTEYILTSTDPRMEPG